MLRQAEYHPEAKSEMLKAASWYDDKVDGLGLDFLFEVKNNEGCRDMNNNCGNPVSDETVEFSSDWILL